MVLPINKIVFWTTSHDQGWSDHERDHGTYRGSFSWFKAIISGAPTPDPPRLTFQNNIHASSEWREHINVFDRRTATDEVLHWMDCLTVGTELQIWAKAAYEGWENHVKMVRVDISGSGTKETKGIGNIGNFILFPSMSPYLQWLSQARQIPQVFFSIFRTQAWKRVGEISQSLNYPISGRQPSFYRLSRADSSWPDGTGHYSFAMAPDDDGLGVVMEEVQEVFLYK